MRSIPSRVYPIQPHLSRGRWIAGLLYLACHCVLIPLALDLYFLKYAPTPTIMELAGQNAVYYAAGLAFVLAVLSRWLREEFYFLLDAPLRCLRLLVLGFFLYFILAFAVSLVMQYGFSATENPNQSAVNQMIGQARNPMFGLTVFLAPLVEETLFRGVLFGGIHSKNRTAAYAVSMAAFSLYHVWQYIAFTGNFSLLIYGIVYLPAGFVLAWQYERSGSVWTPVFLHMIINAMGFLLQ